MAQLAFTLLVCAFLILMAYQFLVIEPSNQKKAAEAKARAAAAAPAGPAQSVAPLGVQVVPRQQAVAASPRVPIATPSLKGSLSLRGGLL